MYLENFARRTKYQSVCGVAFAPDHQIDVAHQLFSIQGGYFDQNTAGIVDLIVRIGLDMISCMVGVSYSFKVI